MNKQKIKEVLNNAPNGATHYHKHSESPYWKLTYIGGYQRFVHSTGNLLNEEPDKIYGLYILNELRTQLALIEENEKLKALLTKVKQDLLMRAETDSEGFKVVDLSSSIWEQVKELSND